MCDNRFKELIEPLRDLAANWDIDIADSLNHYLEELDGLNITFDATHPSNINFAEAALLIQGSTSIYSRKVEYLYKLVMQSLEFITNQNKANNPTANGKQRANNNNNAAIDEERLLFGSEPDYLLLDDVVMESDNIDIAETDNSKDKSRNSVIEYLINM